MRVSELTGTLLDYWVARAQGLPLSTEWNYAGEEYIMIGTGAGDLEAYSPSTWWEQGGQIIENELIGVYKTRGYAQHMGAWTALTFAEFEHYGPTPLVAAMRAYVVSKFGKEVPDDPSTAPSSGEKRSEEQ